MPPRRDARVVPPRCVNLRPVSGGPSRAPSPLCLADPPKRYWIAIDLDSLNAAVNLRGIDVVFSMAATMATPAAPEIYAKYMAGQLDYLPYVPNPHQDELGVAPFAATASRDYTVEVLLETVRKQVDPLLPPGATSA